MITIRANQHDLDLVAKGLKFQIGKAKIRVRDISEEHGVTVEFNAGEKAELSRWQRMLPSVSIRAHHFEGRDEKLHFELKEVSVSGWALPGWTVKAGMKIIRSERVQQWIPKEKVPIEFNSPSQVALLLERIKKKLPFDFKIADINFVGDEAVVRLTVVPLPAQKGM